MSEETEPTEPASINEDKLADLLREMEANQNLAMGVLAGAAAAIAGAAIWAAVTVATQYQIGFMAVGVGLLVGFAVRIAGKGVTPTFAYIGAAFALIGCLMGNFLSVVGFISIEESLPYFQVLGMIDYAQLPDIMFSTFQPMDLLFYAIAVYEGYKFSLLQLTGEQVMSLQG